MKKISILTRSIPLHGPGGMERSTWSVATGLAERGWEVEIITTTLPHSAPSEIEGVRIHAIAGSRPARYSTAFAAGARRRLSEGNPHAPVISVSAAGFDYLSIAPAKRRPVILVCHGTSWDEIRSKLRVCTPRSLFGLLRQLTFLPRDIAAYRAADRIVSINAQVSDQIARFLDKSQRHKLRVVHNGVMVPKVGSVARSQNEGFTLCVSGRLVREKGVHLLLEACAALGPSARPSRVLICGSGPERERLEAQVFRLGLKGVIFTGHVPDVTPYLREACALVFPSIRVEGLTLSVLEALAAGLPAIIPESTPVPPIAQGGLIRFSPNSPESLGRAIEQVRSSRESVTLAPEFTREHMVDEYARVALELNSETGASRPAVVTDFRATSYPARQTAP